MVTSFGTNGNLTYMSFGPVIDHEYSVSLPMIKASVPGKYSRGQQRSPGPLSTSLCPCTQGNDQRNEIIPNKDCGFPYPVKKIALFRKISTLSSSSYWGVPLRDRALRSNLFPWKRISPAIPDALVPAHVILVPIRMLPSR